MATETTVIPVKILGIEYMIEAEADPEHTKQVARYVDSKMREVMGSLPTQSVQNITILAAMEMANDLLRERREKEEITERMERLVELLNKVTLP
jgi:cell division protein ZapA